VVLVGALVVADDSVLLLQRSSRETFMPNAWGLPAGKINYGEAPEAAVLRELGEEAGITGTVHRLAGTVWFQSKVGNEVVDNMQMNFLVTPSDQNVVLDAANQRARWLPLDEVVSRPAVVDEFTRNSILDAKLLEGIRR
jgi:8-oxo-dGTP diphosphatase